MSRSVGIFFLTSQIPYPLNLIVNSPYIGKKTKYTNNTITKTILSKDNTVNIGQFSKFAMKFKKNKFLTEN